LSDSELFRLERYNAMRLRLEAIDSRTPEFQKQYVTGPEGFVPSQAEIDAFGRALEGVRNDGPTPQGPVNTFDNPGGLKGSCLCLMLSLPPDFNAAPGRAV
jgi:hypothetical protein